MVLEYIPKRAIHVQKYDMTKPGGLHMGLNKSIQKFVKSLNDLDCYLLYFPEDKKNLKHLKAHFEAKSVTEKEVFDLPF
jgi:hypothetical protein